MYHLIILYLPALASIIFASRVTEMCPSFCACDMWYGLRRASCTGHRLYSIHTDVSELVQALDLSDNSISSLTSFELANANLTRLKFLNLSGNAIGEIDLNAFALLAELTVLDLSRNHLHYLLSDTFVNSVNLRVLRLVGNNFNVHVPKLRCSSLTELNMSSCRIGHVPPGTFEGLEHLRDLDLSNNLMIQLDNRLLRSLSFLGKFTFNRNPWSCNQLMYDLQAYLRSKSISFDAVCHDQEATRSKKFEKMISLVESKPSDSPTSVKSNENNVWITDSPNTTITTSSQETHTITLEAVYSYWFFASGFILGSAVGMVMTYIWLSKIFSCSLPNVRRRTCTESRNSSSQRVSLLQNLWQHDDESNGNNIASETLRCPGTPPPPYRDVILHTSLYPIAPSVILVGDDNVRSGEPHV